jgi:WD40 repeat protein
MAKLFVSYSRRDSTAARKLIEAFRTIEQEVWVDWESIPPAADWLEQILRGIEEADAFIFMVSPDSIASEVCKVEIGHAAKNNKRIIPIVLRDVKPQDSPESIRKLNWTFIRESDPFEEGLAKVKTAIELDLDWLEEHRRLQVRALEWHRKKDVSLLLRGRDLRNAMRMVQTYTAKDPIPSDLQKKYIDHSRRTERNRTIAWIATAIAVISLAILSYTTYQQSVLATQNEVEARKQANIAKINEDEARNSERQARKAQLEAETEREKALEQEQKAKAQELIAEAQRSAARAQIFQTRTGELFTSTLLALDSWEKSPSVEAEEILRKNISLLPLPVNQASQNGVVTALEIHPDGESFLTASKDGSACVRNLADAKELFCATRATSVNDAIFVQGGASVAIGDESGVVQVLDAENGTVEREIDAGSPIRVLDVAPNGEDLAIARANGIVTILNLVNTKKPSYSLQITGTLTAAEFSPNGRWFAAGSQAGVVTVWNLNERDEIFYGSRHKGAVIAIQFSPNSRFVISGGEDNYAVGFDIQTGNEIFQLLHSDWVRDIAFAPDSSWFATASDDARVRVWNLNSGKEELIMFQDSAIGEVQISSDGKWIAATGADNTARVWSAFNGVEMFQIPLNGAGTKLRFSADNQLLISGDENGDIAIWDISGMSAPEKVIQFNELTWISKFTSTGTRLIASDANRVWLLNPGSIPTRLRLASNSPIQFKNDIYDIAVSPDAKTIGISTYENEYIIYNLTTLIPVRVRPAGEANAIAFSADSTRFITATTDGVVETWDTRTGKQINAFDEGDTILSIAVSPAGIALGAKDKIVLLDANAEQQEIPPWNAPGENQFLSFNADGSLLASANSSGQVQIWKQANKTFDLLNTITREQPYSIAFHPQENTLAVGSVDNVYIFDAESGEELHRIPHNGLVYSVSFSPDGETLATAALKLIQIWNVAALPKPISGDLTQAACSRLIQNFSESEWTVLFGDEQPYVKLCENLPIPG